MSDIDLEYFRSRELEERVAAQSSTDPTVRDIHFTLAERYADVVWGAEEAAAPSVARVDGQRGAPRL